MSCIKLNILTLLLFIGLGGTRNSDRK